MIEAQRLFRVVQLVLSHLNLRILSQVHYFSDSQWAVYRAPSKESVFRDTNKQIINETWLLHVVYFFKYHVATAGEATLWAEYLFLDAFYKPRPWQGKLEFTSEPKMLGPSWKGSYGKFTFAYPQTQA